MNKSCIIGCPVEHSLSPRLHRYWLKQYKKTGQYTKRAVEPQDFEQAILSLAKDGYAGCNLTIPHKTVAIKFMDDLSPRASAIGAVNTVVVMNDGGLLGDNTDAFGYIEGLTHQIPEWREHVQRVAVIGAGGAARAIVYGLIKENIEQVCVFNRTLANAKDVVEGFADIQTTSELSADSFDALQTRLSEFDLIINTTPLGMKGQKPLPLDLSGAKDTAIVSDIVYNPRITPLLQDASDRGLKTVEGMHMLVYQGAPGFEYWFGDHPEISDPVIEHMLEALK